MHRLAALFPLVLLSLTGCTLDPSTDEDPAAADEDVGTAQEALTFGNVGSSMRVVNSNMCMATQTEPNGVVRVVQQPCASQSSMWFYARPVNGSLTIFTIEAAGRCLDIPSSSTTSGVDVQLTTCNGGLNQRFTLTELANGYEIRPRSAPGLCLDVEWNNSIPGQRLQQGDCNNQTNQRFLIRPTLATETFDCDQEDALYMRWPFPSFNNYSSVTLHDGQVAHFDFNWVRWEEGGPTTSSGLWDWDDEHVCPTGTRTIEVSRLQADRDEFRLRCYR